MTEVPPKMAESATTKKRKASAHTAAPVDKRSPRWPLNSFALERAFLNQDKKQNSGSLGTKTVKNNATPNLTNQRNKRITKIDTDGFTHPAKTNKGNLLNTLTDASPSTTNKFDPLSIDGDTAPFDSMETESQIPPTNSNDNNADQSTAEKNNTQEVVKEKTYRPPPILIPGEAVSKTVTSIRIANIEQDSFVITLSKGLHSVQASNQVSYETIKKTLKEASIQYYTYTPKGDRPKSVLLKGISEDFTPAQVADYLKSKNIPYIEILKVSELKFNGKDNNPVTNVGSNQSKNRQLDRRIEVLNRGINPQLSFANVATTSRENFPPLRQRHSQEVINFQQQFQQQFHHPAQQQQASYKETQDQSGVDQLRNEISSLSKEIRLMGASIHQSIANNSQRIDFLFNFLGVQHG
ncbi:hypothetical protein KQX54_012740 [Cotesia glomerata]|uniref:Uncharacterized protein n=1 Tax=Cotesia glomerata TaxID=32391 RepID=A0AAV7ISQ8_COTGL|nr:hypothetical protein KQX54_012740 [Cotesia glomerata]